MSDGQPYPVHFSASDTSGEKAYEEFYVEGESLNKDRFNSLGIIIDKPIPDRSKVFDLIEALSNEFESDTCTKEEIVRLISDYLPSFNHIETKKNLDEKM